VLVARIPGDECLTLAAAAAVEEEEAAAADVCKAEARWIVAGV